MCCESERRYAVAQTCAVHAFAWPACVRQHVRQGSWRLPVCVVASQRVLRCGESSSCAQMGKPASKQRHMLCCVMGCTSAMHAFMLPDQPAK
jgi:hypothetical protein